MMCHGLSVRPDPAHPRGRDLGLIEHGQRGCAEALADLAVDQEQLAKADRLGCEGPDPLGERARQRIGAVREEFQFA